MVGTARHLALVCALMGAPSAFAQTPMVIDLAPFQPFAAGELVFVQEYAGQVIGAEVEAKLVSNESEPWTVNVTFGLPTGSVSIGSQDLGWQGVGTFETHLATDAMNGLIEPIYGAPLFTGFMAWSVAVGALPAPGLGFEPFDGEFEVLRLTVHFAPCPWGDPKAPWESLGGGIVGSAGKPRLQGSGSLCPGEVGTLALMNGLPSGTAFLVVGFSRLDLPFGGGRLAPSPDLVLPWVLDAAGEGSLPFDWPPGAAPGLELFLQAWLADPTGPAGLSASNGLCCLAP